MGDYSCYISWATLGELVASLVLACLVCLHQPYALHEPALAVLVLGYGALLANLVGVVLVSAILLYVLSLPRLGFRSSCKMVVYSQTSTHPFIYPPSRDRLLPMRLLPLPAALLPRPPAPPARPARRPPLREGSVDRSGDRRRPLPAVLADSQSSGGPAHHPPRGRAANE